MPHSETYLKGKRLVSVTQALGIIRKPFLEKWYGKYGTKRCEQKTRAAVTIGSFIHDCIELYVNGDGGTTIIPTIRAKNMFHTFREWFDISGLVPEVTEFKVISKKYGYAGTLDAVMKLGDEYVLYDWKTSSGIYKEMGWQLAAYAQAYKEQTGIEIKRGVVVLVSKDKPKHKVTVKEFELGTKQLKPFLHALALYKAVCPESKKKLKEAA